MSRLSTCKESALEASTLEALEPVRMRGNLADVYLQFANSEPAIRAYLVMEQALQQGSLTLAEVECVKLLVSELTQCDHCLSVHTFKATQAGVAAAEQLALRRGEALDNNRLDAICRLVRSLFTERGPIDDATFDELKKAGFTDEQLVDICMAMSTIFFTNMTNHINRSESSLPDAPSIA